jgi:hypothetical protein
MNIKINATPDDKFNPQELKMGIRHETEHTDDRYIAKSIAKDHLLEIPDYYTRLERMEREAREEHEIDVFIKDARELRAII